MALVRSEQQNLPVISLSVASSVKYPANMREKGK